MTRYRLTIATRRAATTFCITAETEAAARRKAALIASGWNIAGAKIQLTPYGFRVNPLPPRQPNLADLMAPASLARGAAGPLAAS